MITATQTTPATILRSVLAAKKSRNAAYSISALARDVGVSQPLLSQILNERRPLSMTQAQKIAVMLDMDKDEAQALLDSTAFHSTKNKKLKTKLERAAASRESNRLQAVEIEKFTTIAKWYHLPILALVMTKDFKNNPTWIAKRLGITAKEAKEALERLKRLALVEERDGKLRENGSRIEFTPKKSEVAVREHHCQMMNRARETMIAKTDERDWLAREISGISMAVNSAKMPEAKELVKRFKEDLLSLMTQGEADEVYQLNVQLFPLSRSYT